MSRSASGSKPPAYASLHAPGAVQRRDAEDYIAAVFARAYGARIRQFMPELLSLRAASGAVLAALGLRACASGRVFLEAYLDAPLETVLAAALRRPVSRTRVMEVGNLASGTPGGARWLVTSLTAHLDARAFEWAVFTATPMLRRTFARLGIELVHLAEADPVRLGSARVDWGRYYECAPTVMAASVAQSRDALLHHIESSPVGGALRPSWGHGRTAYAEAAA